MANIVVEALKATDDLFARHPAGSSNRHAALFSDRPTPLQFVPLKKFNRYLIYCLELPDRTEIYRVRDAALDVQAFSENSS